MDSRVHADSLGVKKKLSNFSKKMHWMKKFYFNTFLDRIRSRSLVWMRAMCRKEQKFSIWFDEILLIFRSFSLSINVFFLQYYSERYKKAKVQCRAKNASGSFTQALLTANILRRLGKWFSQGNSSLVANFQKSNPYYMCHLKLSAVESSLIFTASRRIKPIFLSKFFRIPPTVNRG